MYSVCDMWSEHPFAKSQNCLIFVNFLLVKNKEKNEPFNHAILYKRASFVRKRQMRAKVMSATLLEFLITPGNKSGFISWLLSVLSWRLGKALIARGREESKVDTTIPQNREKLSDLSGSPFTFHSAQRLKRCMEPCNHCRISRPDFADRRKYSENANAMQNVDDNLAFSLSGIGK